MFVLIKISKGRLVFIVFVLFILINVVICIILLVLNKYQFIELSTFLICVVNSK